MSKIKKIKLPNGTVVDIGVTWSNIDNKPTFVTYEDIDEAIDYKLAANDAMVFKGTLGATHGTVASLPSEHEVGWTYRVVDAGVYAGDYCEEGDLVICIQSSEEEDDSGDLNPLPVTPTPGLLGAGNDFNDWTVVQTNIDGAVISSGTSDSGNLAVFGDSSGKYIVDSGFTITQQQDEYDTELATTGYVGTVIDDLGYYVDNNFKPLQTAVTSPAANGNATAFIDTISQDTEGVITATKKSLNIGAVTGISIDSTPINNSTNLITSGAVYTAINSVDALPAQTNNSGKFLTTNGTSASWATVEALPSQTGNSGKFLTTNGSAASWATVSVPTASTTTPAMDGTASYGSGTTYARGNHVHPTDTSRAPVASPTFTGTPAAPTATAGTDTTQIATTAFVNTAISNKITYGTSDLTEGTSPLATGVIYLLYTE